MDAVRFDALSRSLSTTRSRRSLARLLGGLSLGGVLSANTSREAAAVPLNGGSACTSDSDCKTGKCLASGKCSCSSAFPTCKQPANRCKKATCSSGRCVTSNKPKGATCSDGISCTINDACDGQGRCIGTPKHGRCPSGDRCTQGRCRPTDAGRDANGCVFTPLTTGECGTGTCTRDSDCCPADNPGCVSNGDQFYKYCDSGNCVCASSIRPNYPHACVFAPNPGECQECCTNDHCVQKFADPDRACFFGHCACSAEKPRLCSERVAGGKAYCTDPRSDPENCSPFVEDCGTKCAPEFDCINGQCTFAG